MAKQIIRDFVLPNPTEPDTLYLIAREENPALPLSAYVTDKQNQLRTLFSIEIVNNVVQSHLQGRLLSAVVGNLNERDTLELNDNAVVLVHNNGYPPIDQPKGRMTYFYVHETKQWFPIAGDAGGVITWETISGRPVSDAASIDDAVNKRHEHTNKGVLDKLGENATGQPTYDGKALSNVRLTTAEF